MSGLTTYSEDLVLAWLLTTDVVTRPTAWYVALHTGDPGETGDSNELTTGADADYVRKVVTFATPLSGSGQSLNSTAVSWTVNSGSSGFNITHISIKDAVTAGNTLQKGPLLAVKAMVASGVFTMQIGDIAVIAD